LADERWGQFLWQNKSKLKWFSEIGNHQLVSHSWCNC
jgi:hypothetical protein